jgi:hypothetical protein
MPGFAGAAGAFIQGRRRRLRARAGGWACAAGTTNAAASSAVIDRFHDEAWEHYIGARDSGFGIREWGPGWCL